MATSLALAGAERPDHVQFHDIMGVLKGKDKGHLDAISGSYTQVQRCVIEDGHKLILYPKIKKALLFDLEADPEEMNDLAAEPGSKKRMQAMFKTFQRLQEENGDKLDLASVYPGLATP